MDVHARHSIIGTEINRVSENPGYKIISQTQPQKNRKTRK